MHCRGGLKLLPSLLLLMVCAVYPPPKPCLAKSLFFLVSPLCSQNYLLFCLIIINKSTSICKAGVAFLWLNSLSSTQPPTEWHQFVLRHSHSV